MNIESNQAIQIFKPDFSDKTLHVYGTFEDPLFKMKELGEFLELPNIHKNVAQLPSDFVHRRSTPVGNGTREMVYLTAPGLNYLLMKIRPTGPRKELIEKFQKWVCCDVLESIRKHGFYLSSTVNEEKLQLDLEERKLDLKVKRAETFKICYGVFTEISIPDERDELAAADYMRAIVFDDTVEIDHGTAISKRLKEKFKYTKHNPKLLIKIGRLMADQYRQLRGDEPVERDQYVDGIKRKVKHYKDQDYIDFGDQCIAQCLNEANKRSSQKFRQQGIKKTFGY